MREIIVLADQATEGAPSIEKIETDEVVPDGFLGTKLTRLSFCSSCGRAIQKQEDIFARCECGGVMCPDPQCSGVRCSQEDCLKILCPRCRCRSLLSSSVLCPGHARIEKTGCMIALAVVLLILLAISIALVVLLKE
jgi:hypothetical protein